MGLSRMDNPETLTTLGTQDTGRRQSRDTDNIGYTRHRTKTIQTLTTLGTQDTERRHNKTNNTTQKTKMKSNTDPTKNLG